MKEGECEKVIINLNGQLKYIDLTYKYWNEFKLINNAKLVITTEQFVKYKNGDTQEITKEYLDELGLKYDKLTIFTENQIMDMKKDIDRKFNNIKHYYNKLQINYLYRSLMRFKHFQFFLNNNPEYQGDEFKIAYMRSDFLIGNINKKCDDNPIAIHNENIYPSIINNMNNIRISDFFIFGDYNSCKILTERYLDIFGYYFCTNINPDKLISSEAQFNQTIKKLFSTTEIKFADIRDFKNNLYSFNLVYNDKIKELTIRKFGINKNNVDYDNIKINENELIHNFNNIRKFDHQEIYNRIKLNNEYNKFNTYQELVEFVEESKYLKNIYVENKTIKLNNNNIIVLGDLHRTNYNNFKCFINDTNTSIIYVKYLPFWFLNLFNNLFKIERPNLVYYPSYLWGGRGRSKNHFNFKYSNKPIDILVYGAYMASIKPDITTKKYLETQNYINLDLYYELRHRLITKILKDEKLKDINIKFIQLSDNIRGDDLFKLINQSKFTIATCSNVLYLFNKYFEIPLNNSIIIGNIPEYAPKKMKENIINIKNSMSDNEIIDILIDSVNNYESHKTKLQLGKWLYDASNIISELDYIRDSYIYQKTNIKTKRLEEFNKFYTVEFPGSYNNEY